MSNKRQETVADIVAEMRSNEFDDPRFGRDGLLAARTLARGWADRIEAAGEGFAAGEQSATDCNKLGNAAAMREALNEIQLVCYKAGITIEYDVACGIIKSKSRAALSAPPRNCDVGTAQDALATIHNDRCYVRNPIDERRLTVNWLFAEAEKEESK